MELGGGNGNASCLKGNKCRPQIGKCGDCFLIQLGRALVFADQLVPAQQRFNQYADGVILIGNG